MAFSERTASASLLQELISRMGVFMRALPSPASSVGKVAIFLGSHDLRLRIPSPRETLRCDIPPVTHENPCETALEYGWKRDQLYDRLQSP